MKEKWICPNLDVQVFTPQEYIAACWYLQLYCEGTPLSGKTGSPETFVFKYPGEEHYLSPQMDVHDPHFIRTIYAKTEDDNPPSEQYLEDTLGEFHSAMATEEAIKVGPGTLLPNKTDHYTVGYTWPGSDGHTWCFAKVLNWQLRNQTAS